MKVVCRKCDGTKSVTQVNPCDKTLMIGPCWLCKGAGTLETDSYHIVSAPDMGKLSEMWEVVKEFECMRFESYSRSAFDWRCPVGVILYGRMVQSKNWRNEPLYEIVDIVGEGYAWTGVPADCIEPLMKTIMAEGIDGDAALAITRGITRQDAKGLMFPFRYGGQGMPAQPTNYYEEVVHKFQKVGRSMAQNEIFARYYGRPET